ncbi:MAG: hypothetical protein ACRC1U_10480, partial [Vibrionaceae bacterium]
RRQIGKADPRQDGRQKFRNRKNRKSERACCILTLGKIGLSNNKLAKLGLQSMFWRKNCRRHEIKLMKIKNVNKCALHSNKRIKNTVFKLSDSIKKILKKHKRDRASTNENIRTFQVKNTLHIRLR